MSLPDDFGELKHLQRLCLVKTMLEAKHVAMTPILEDEVWLRFLIWSSRSYRAVWVAATHGGVRAARRSLPVFDAILVAAVVAAAATGVSSRSRRRSSGSSSNSRSSRSSSSSSSSSK